MCWGSQWGAYRTYRTYRMCWGSQWAAAAPGEETYPAFFWASQPLGGNLPGFFLAAPGEDYWLLFGALGRTSVGGNRPGFLAAPPGRGFWGAHRILPQRFGAFTWCLHLVPPLGAFSLYLVPSLGTFLGAFAGTLPAHIRPLWGSTL